MLIASLPVRGPSVNFLQIDFDRSEKASWKNAVESLTKDVKQKDEQLKKERKDAEEQLKKAKDDLKGARKEVEEVLQKDKLAKKEFIALKSQNEKLEKDHKILSEDLVSFTLLCWWTQGVSLLYLLIQLLYSCSTMPSPPLIR